MMVGGYALFATVTTVSASPFIAVPLALAVGAAVGVLVYALLMRPMAGHPVFAAVLVTVSLGILLRVAVVLVYTDQTRYPLPAMDLSNPPVRLPGGAAVSALDVVTVASAAALLGGLFAFLRLSRLGIRMRAAAERPLLAAQRGIDFHALFALSWALASFAGALAGVLYADRGARRAAPRGVALRPRARHADRAGRRRCARLEHVDRPGRPDLAGPRRIPLRGSVHRRHPDREREGTAARHAAGGGRGRRTPRSGGGRALAEAQRALSDARDAGHALRGPLRGQRVPGALGLQHGGERAGADRRRRPLPQRRAVVLRPRGLRHADHVPQREPRTLPGRPGLDGHPRSRDRRCEPGHRRRPLQAPGLRRVLRADRAGRRALGVLPLVRVGRSILVRRDDRVHRDDRDRRHGLDAGGAPRRRFRDAAAVRHRRRRRCAGSRRRRTLLALPAQVRG